MATEWKYRAEIEFDHGFNATKRAFANQLATIAEPDAHVYEDKDWIRVDKSSAPDNPVMIDPPIWTMSTPTKQAFKDAIDLYNAGGYPQIFTDAGVTNEQIDFARTFITANVS